MLINLGHAFEQQEFADVDVLLLAPQPDAAADVAPAMEIRRLPSHVVILSASPYFKAQVHTCSMLPKSTIRQHSEHYQLQRSSVPALQIT